ncbi:MAG: hypothetical protein R2991_01380 [Thermoanaerobaculia bacterium]
MGLLAELHRSATLAQEVASLRRELRDLGRFGRMIGTSRPMQEVYDLIEEVARSHLRCRARGRERHGKGKPRRRRSTT